MQILACALACVVVHTVWGADPPACDGCVDAQGNCKALRSKWISDEATCTFTICRAGKKKGPHLITRKGCKYEGECLAPSQRKEDKDCCMHICKRGGKMRKGNCGCKEGDACHKMNSFFKDAQGRCFKCARIRGTHSSNVKRRRKKNKHCLHL